MLQLARLLSAAQVKVSFEKPDLSMLLQVKSVLSVAQAEVNSLKAELSKAQGTAANSERLQQALDQAEEGSRALQQEGRRQQAQLERQLTSTGRDRDQLAEQVLCVAPHVLAKLTDNAKLCCSPD